MGLHKVDALARKLALVNPYARVSRHKVQLNGQEPTSRVAEALRAASSCDLIIDATCSLAVFNLVSGITVGDKTPLICGEVLGGGWGSHSSVRTRACAVALLDAASDPAMVQRTKDIIAGTCGALR